MADFRGFAERLVGDLEKQTEDKLRFAVQGIGVHLAILIHPFEYVLRREDTESLRNLEIAADSARTLDAVHWLDDSADVLNGRSRRVFDFSRGTRDPREFLRLFDTTQLTRRINFAYVAWSERASDGERVKYVGKACDESRLDFHKHSSLVAAMAASTTLSLVFPKINSERAALATEAALLHLVTIRDGQPRYNVRKANLNHEGHQRGRKFLREASGHLAEYARRLERLL